MPNLRHATELILDWGRPTPRADDLQLRIKDDVFQWQVSGKDFTRIDADTLLRADVCVDPSTASKVIAAAHKIGIVNAQTGEPDTTKVDRYMLNQIPKISERKQRELVLLLFFMEEEINRWRLLSNEEESIKQKLIDGSVDAATRSELQQGLRTLQDQKIVLPSHRNENGTTKQSVNAALPTYVEAGR